MAQPQRQADVHQDDLCPPNKRYALIDANRKIDLDNPLCANESKILANIIQNHPLRYSIASSSSVLWIKLGQFWHTLRKDESKYRLKKRHPICLWEEAPSMSLGRGTHYVFGKRHPLCLWEEEPTFNIGASSSVPWIYLGQFWHTLKEDGSKYRLSFMLDKKELTLTLDDFRTIFQLPQATDNNHERFVVAPKFSKMVPFFLNDLGFTLELRSPSNMKTTSLMLYCFVNNMHVDYADLLWEGLHYSLEHPSTLIPYPRFTKLIVSHYMVAFPGISRRVCDKYHNLEDDEMVKSIFNSGKNKDGVGMKIPIFGVDVPTTQSQPIKSTQGTHRTTSAFRTPNPDVAEGELSAS
ncbi:hypothetical protein Tco_0896578 [Tanacetum coccineum]